MLKAFFFVASFGVLLSFASVGCSLSVGYAHKPDSAPEVALLVRQRGNPVVLPVDGDGYTRYPDCSSDRSLYDILSNVFFKCLRECLTPQGCPPKCCIALIGAGQLLACETPGRCIRFGFSTSRTIGWASLEYFSARESKKEFICPLANMTQSTTRCGLRFNQDEEFVCADGVDIPNTEEILIADNCDVNGSKPVATNKADSSDEQDPINEGDPSDGEVSPGDKLPGGIGDSEEDDESSNPRDSGAGSRENSDTSCFPADATVYVKGKGRVPMSALSIGDAVSVGKGKYSEVYMFSHKLDDNVQRDFIRIDTASGKSLRLSSGHYIYLKDSLVEAGSIRVGDILVSSDFGGEEQVIAVSRKSSTGLYNPQTVHGDIAVDGILCSTFTAGFPMPWLAHNVLLAPCRYLHSVFGLSCGNALEGEHTGGESLRRAWKAVLAASSARSEL